MPYNPETGQYERLSFDQPVDQPQKSKPSSNKVVGAGRAVASGLVGGVGELIKGGTLLAGRVTGQETPPSTDISDWLIEKAKEIRPNDESFINHMGEIAGNMAPLILSAVQTGGATIPAILGMISSYANRYDRLKAEVGDEKAKDVATKMLVPDLALNFVSLGKFIKPLTRPGVAGRIIGGLESGATMAGAGVAGQSGEQYLLDKPVTPLENLKQQGPGAAVGFLLGGAMRPSHTKADGTVELSKKADEQFNQDVQSEVSGLTQADLTPEGTVQMQPAEAAPQAKPMTAKEHVAELAKSEPTAEQIKPLIDAAPTREEKVALIDLHDKTVKQEEKISQHEQTIAEDHARTAIENDLKRGKTPYDGWEADYPDIAKKYQVKPPETKVVESPVPKQETVLPPVAEPRPSEPVSQGEPAPLEPKPVKGEEVQKKEPTKSIPEPPKGTKPHKIDGKVMADVGLKGLSRPLEQQSSMFENIPKKEWNQRESITTKDENLATFRDEHKSGIDMGDLTHEDFGGRLVNFKRGGGTKWDIALERAKDLGLAHPDATDPLVLGNLFRGLSKKTVKSESPTEIVSKLETAKPKTVNSMDIEDGSFVRIGDEWHKATAHEDGTTLKDGKTIELGQEQDIKARSIVAPDSIEHKFVAEKYRQQESKSPDIGKGKEGRLKPYEKHSPSELTGLAKEAVEANHPNIQPEIAAFKAVQETSRPNTSKWVTARNALARAWYAIKKALEGGETGSTTLFSFGKKNVKPVEVKPESKPVEPIEKKIESDFKRASELRSEITNKAEISKKDRFVASVWDQFKPMLDKFGKEARGRLDETEFAVNHAAGAIHADAKRIADNVFFGHEKDGLTLNDFKKYALYRRVAYEFANKQVLKDGKEMPIDAPYGLTEQSAKALLRKMKERLGDESFASLENRMLEFQRIGESTLDSIERGGMVTPEVMREIRKNKDYYTFQHLSKIEEGAGGIIERLKGSLEGISDPIAATIVKRAISRIASEKNGFKRDVIKEALAGKTGEVPFVTEERSSGRQVEMTYFDEGIKKTAYVDPIIAEAFKSEPSTANVVLATIEVGNNLLRDLFVNKNLQFILGSNPGRDVLRTATNLPGWHFWETVGEYAKAMPEAMRAEFLSPESAKTQAELTKRMAARKRVQDLQAEGKIASGYQRGKTSKKRGEDAVVDDLVRSMTDHGGWKDEQTLGAFSRVLQGIEDFGRAADMASKLAADKLINKYGGNLTEFQKKKLYSSAGTPDTTSKGKDARWVSAFTIYGNVAKEGLRGDIYAAKLNPTQWAAKKIVYSVLPKVMMAAGASGAFGEEIKKWWDKIAEGEMGNKVILPLGTDKNGNAVYLGFFQDQTSQMINGAVYNLIKGKSPTDMIKFIGGELPTISPIITTVSDALDFAKGQNVTDTYRGKQIFTPQEMKAMSKDTPSLLEYGGPKMLKYLSAELGGNIFYKFDSTDRAQIQTEVQDMLKMPPGNILGKVLKISSAGEKQAYLNEAKDIESEGAQKSIDQKQKMVEFVKGLDGQPTRQEMVSFYRQGIKDGSIDKKKTFREIANRLTEISVTGGVDNLASALERISTNEGKAAMLKKAKSEMSPSEYRQTTMKYLRDRTISRQTLFLANKP